MIGFGLRGAIVIMAAFALASAAWGHAALVGSEPADRAVVAQSPAEIKLIFNEPVSPLRLRLIGPSGRIDELSRSTALNNTLSVGMPAALAIGTHVLSWRVISADGHPVGGAIVFSVGEPSATPPMQPRSTADRSLQLAIWFAKLVIYVGLFFGVGGTAYSAWIATAPLSRFVQRAIVVALQTGFIAAVISVGLQGADAMDLPLSQLRQTSHWIAGFTTSYGASASVAAGAFAVALCAAEAHALRRWLAALALAGVGAALALSGHASAAAPQLLMRPAVFLHALAVAFWVGALLPLASAMRSADTRAQELSRFSRAIPAAVVVLVATGLALAVVQLGTLAALWSTAYGLLLSGKLALVAVLLAIGAVNRYALTPRIVAGDSGSARRLAASIAIEVGLVVAIFGVVAGWRFTPPPRTLLAVAQSPIQVHIHAARAMADLRFDPVRGRGETVTIALWNENFGPLAAKEVALVLAKPDAGIEPIRLAASHVAETTWRVEGLTIPVSGRWRVRVEALIDDFDKIALEDEVEVLR